MSKKRKLIKREETISKLATLQSRKAFRDVYKEIDNLEEKVENGVGGIASIQTSNTGNVKFTGDGTAENPLKAEANVEVNIASITTTQTAEQLNALADGLYFANGAGVYNISISNSATGVTVTNGKTTVASGYSVSFNKKGSVWSLASSVNIPAYDDSFLLSKVSNNGDALDKIFGKLKETSLNVSKLNIGVYDDGSTSPIVNGFDRGIVRYLGSQSVTSSREFTFYVKYKVKSKNNLLLVSSFIGTTKQIEIPAVVDKEEEIVLTRSLSSLATNDILFQLRTIYDTPSTPKNGVIEIIHFVVFDGKYTLAQIKEKYSEIDMTKINSSYISDKTLNLPDSSLTVIKPLFDKVRSTTSENIVDYNSTTNGITSSNITRSNNLLFINATIANYTGSTSTSRAWYGIDLRPLLYAEESKTYFVILKGKVKGNGIRDLKYGISSSTQFIICQDLEDNVETYFEEVLTISYNKEENSNRRYSYFDVNPRTDIINYNFELELSVFAVLEKTELTNYLSQSDLIKLGLSGKDERLKKELFPLDVAFKEDLNSVIDSIDISQFSPNDYTANGIEMIIGYGQSLATGGGATNAGSDFQNSIMFQGGDSIDSYTSAEVPDSFFSGFKQGVGSKPVDAALVSFLQVLNKENKVKVLEFGNRYLTLTGGVSGASINSMNKGKIPYSNMIKAVTKGKQLANAQGLPFKVSSLNWVQGEADRAMTQEQYYTLLKQFFIDFNTDVKAITTQEDDIKFITYQTASWLNLWYPSGSKTQQSGDSSQLTLTGVQKAQLQVADELPNVYMCGAMYQFPYSDFFHPSDRANVGIQQGVVLKRILVDKAEFPAFKPISHQLIGNFINLKFSVPQKPMRFDLATDNFHNKVNGVLNNYGFKVFKNGIDIINGNLTIINGDTVVIPCSESPIGAEIRYAEDGHYGGGNLCDSQNIVIKNKNQDYIVDNFALSFDSYII